MVKVEAIETLNFEEIRARVQKLQEVVSSLKTDDQIRAKKLELIRQERLFLQQQLSALRLDLEQARMPSKSKVPESRVLN